MRQCPFWIILKNSRRRIIISLIAIAVCVFISLLFTDTEPAMKILRRPADIPLNAQLANWIDRGVNSDGSFMGFLSIALRGRAVSTVQFNKTGPGEAIMAFIKIACYLRGIACIAHCALSGVGVYFPCLNTAGEEVRASTIFNYRSSSSLLARLLPTLSSYPLSSNLPRASSLIRAFKTYGVLISIWGL